MIYILDYIKRISLALWIIFTGTAFLTDKNFAGVIQSAENQKRNYQVHHRVIIYNSLSTFQNSYKSGQNSYESDKMAAIKPENNMLGDTGTFSAVDNVTRKSQSVTLEGKYMLSSHGTEADNLENNGERGLAELSVGSFLDDFKDDPTAQKIYFTSKDLIFSYKSQMNNILQLGFDMKQSETDRLRQLEQEKLRERKGFKDGKPRNNANLEVYSLANILSQINFLTLFIISALILAIYVFFRFFMNKYI